MATWTTWRPVALGACGLLLGAGTLVAGSGPAGSSPAGGALRRQCQEVAAVLSDGPDPAADPVGYAEAQILPLRHLHLADGALRRAVDELSGAYRTLYDADGTGHGVRAAVASASRRVDAICPGATS